MWNQGSVFPLLIVTASGKFVGFFVYDTPAPAAGHLVASVTAQAGTDPPGNAYLPGIVTYSTGAPHIAVQMQGGTAEIQWWHAPSAAGPWSASGPALQDLGGALSILSGTLGGAVQASLLMSSGATQPQASSGFGGPVVLANEGTPANTLSLNAAILFASSGHLNTVSTATGGDGNTYDTESLTLFLAANQILSSTSFAHIFSHAFGVGTYKIDGWLVIQNATPADAAEFTFGYTGTTTVPDLIDFTCISGLSPATTTYTASATFTTVFDTQAVAGNQKLEIHATIGFSSAGTLNFSGRQLVAGNAVTVFGGSRLTISPVVAV